jgi:hypothetical protein
MIPKPMNPSCSGMELLPPSEVFLEDLAAWQNVLLATG